MTSKILTRSVWILSIVSLFTDAASEMLYPIMPLYLSSIGFSIVLIGVLEGIAEATAGLSKGYFGEMSDRYGKRAPFIQIGYSLSAISKPLLAAVAMPLWVVACRALDRLGKGLRTGARDAMLSDEATVGNKGKVFGFHRSMDTLGAVIGPLAALVYLNYHPGEYRILFLIAFLPGIVAVLASFLLKDKTPKSSSIVRNVSFFSSFRYWKRSPHAYRAIAGGLLVFALFNSSDVFLILRIKQSGIGDASVIGLYMFYNLVYAALAFPIGILADRIGLRITLIVGILLFAVTYFGFAFLLSSSSPLVFWSSILLVFSYGVYAAATEGIGKAWISNVCSKDDTATAIGLFSGLQSVAMLVASVTAGIVWMLAGPTMVFAISGAVALAVAIYFVRSSQ